MRSQICTGRRGVVLTDDSDYGGAILPDSHGGDSMAAASPMAFFALQNSGSQTRSASSSIRSSGGRPLLGPRSGVTPVAIYYGRAPGSTAVAMGPGGRRSQPAGSTASKEVDLLPGTASAIAPVGRSTVPGLAPGQIGAPRAAIAPRPNTPASQASIRPREARPTDERAAGAPLQLPGVSTSVPKAGNAKVAVPKAKASEQRSASQTVPKVSSQKTEPKKVPSKKVPQKKKTTEDDE